MGNFYVTSPIYYVNDKPHIGHAYTTIACDVMARFQQSLGHDVYFLTGTDEHGQKVEKAAAAKNISAKVFVDDVSENFKNLAKQLNIINNDFIRTTDERHYKSCQALWDNLCGKGVIYQDNYKGWYAVRDEAYYNEDELTTNAQGQKIAPSGAEVTWVEEPSYFFKLSEFGDKLLKHYHQHPNFIAPESRKKEVIRFVESGLHDLSISRTSFSWGIPVPNNEKHVIYVWLDALTNYITALGYPDTNHHLYQKFWPANLHIVGKDIIRFHAVYWPAFLMAAELPLPQRIYAHGWWTNEGQKISKSLGNVIDPMVLIHDFGLDQTRYFLMRDVPFGQDGDFSRHAIIERSNRDLANDLGNLVQRTLTMIVKNCESQLTNINNDHEDDKKIQEQAKITYDKVTDFMQQQQFHRACEEIWILISAANRYIDHQAPWGLKKTDPQRMHVILSQLVDIIRRLALLVSCFIPDSADKILDQINVVSSQRSLIFYDAILHAGHNINNPSPIFKKIDITE